MDHLKALKITASIPTDFIINEMYRNGSNDLMVLRSIIFYGFGHYIFTVFDQDERAWILYDDTKIE